MRVSRWPHVFRVKQPQSLIEPRTPVPEWSFQRRLITGVILFWPQAQLLLKFGSITWGDMTLAAGLGIILLVVLEGCKPVVRRAFTRAKVTTITSQAAMV